MLNGHTQVPWYSDITQQLGQNFPPYLLGKKLLTMCVLFLNARNVIDSH